MHGNQTSFRAESVIWFPGKHVVHACNQTNNFFSYDILVMLYPKTKAKYLLNPLKYLILLSSQTVNVNANLKLIVGHLRNYIG